jgi:steroid 5-alpha reductase family enzyme
VVSGFAWGGFARGGFAWSGFAWGGFAPDLAWAAAAALAVMLATFAVAVRAGRHRIVDVAWGIGFTAVAAVTFAASTGQGDLLRRLLVTVLTVVWGLRLAAHIARRGRGHGEDPRYEAMLAKAPGHRNAYALRKVYLLQGALVWLVSLPVQAAQYVQGPPSVLGWAGVALWAVGLAFEAVGDAQLARFKSDPAGRGKIMDRGLWSWTRHPNYFGDFCVWWGLFLLACDNPAAAGVSVVSPVVMSLLLIRGSGKRLLERHMAGRPGYAAYVARTSGFFPCPPRRES